jgi:hypothetical protein
MDNTTFRILDIISAYLGESFSINRLTEKIKETYGTAHYANIYKRLHDLEKQDILNLKQFGKSSIVELNFRNYLLTDFLTEMEIRKKIEFLKRKEDLQIFLAELEGCLNSLSSIKSVCSIRTEENLKLNRIELLFLLRNSEEGMHVEDETVRIYAELQRLQKKYNLRIDSLVLEQLEFSSLLRTDEINPLNEILSKKLALFCPQAFWNEIRETVEKGIKIRPGEMETKPAHVNEIDLLYNLARFGYREFGAAIEQGKKFCIEYVITALLLSGDARRIEAIPIIIAKNDFKSNVMIFLAQKFGLSGRLLGLLRILQDIKHTKEVSRAMRLLEALDVKETQADERSILDKMRLYDAA